MKRVDLIQQKHEVKKGSECDYIEPNITEDSMFFLDDEPVGFYIKSVDGKLKQYLQIANKEFRSDNVPKTKMSRTTVATKEAYDLLKKGNLDKKIVKQFSTIIGSIPPKAQFKRTYCNMSSVHSVKTAKTFIKAMLLSCLEAEKIVKELLPNQYSKQLEIFKEVNDKWKFGNIFTSSISNYNINAPYHQDIGNFKNTINIILTKRHLSKGGCLNVPDYGITIEQADNSMLVYPAWKNIHGVTPIVTSSDKGYRNSLIFYPLKAFKGMK